MIPDYHMRPSQIRIRKRHAHKTARMDRKQSHEEDVLVNHHEVRTRDCNDKPVLNASQGNGYYQLSNGSARDFTRDPRTRRDTIRRHAANKTRINVSRSFRPDELQAHDFPDDFFHESLGSFAKQRRWHGKESAVVEFAYGLHVVLPYIRNPDERHPCIEAISILAQTPSISALSSQHDIEVCEKAHWRLMTTIGWYKAMWDDDILPDVCPRRINAIRVQLAKMWLLYVFT